MKFLSKYKIALATVFMLFFTSCGIDSNSSIFEGKDFKVTIPKDWVLENFEKNTDLVALFYISNKEIWENMIIFRSDFNGNMSSFISKEIKSSEKRFNYEKLSTENAEISKGQKTVIHSFTSQKDLESPKMLFLQTFTGNDNAGYILLCTLEEKSENIDKCKKAMLSFVWKTNS